MSEKTPGQEWLNIYYDELFQYICTNVPIIDPYTCLYRVTAALHKCKAKSYPQFREWAKRAARNAGNEIRIFDGARKLTIQDVLTLAETRHVRRGTKPFVYEIHGDNAFVKLESRGEVYPWIIPSDWLPVAKALWPVYIRHNSKSGPYVAKKIYRQRLTGTWYETILPVHRLFLNCEQDDAIQVKNGNWLDWSGGNLQVAATPDPLDRVDRLTGRIAEGITLDWKPAAPTRSPQPKDGNPLAQSDRRVLAWLRGEIEKV